MAILDPNGNEVTSNPKVIHAASTSTRRGPQFQVRNKSLDELISERDRDVIMSLSQRLFLNIGACQSVVDQKAEYSVGTAWLPVYKGKDTENGQIVTDWLINTFFRNLDVRGGLWDWWENLLGVSKEMDIRGDHFTLLTQDDDGIMPKIKFIPAHAIKNKKTKYVSSKRHTVDGGKYEGYKICYGVIYDDNGKAVAYRVSTGDGMDEFEDIEASSLIHQFEPKMQEDGRGLPAATHALEDLKHILQSTEFERTRQMIISSIGLFIENDLGGPDPNDPSNSYGGNSLPSGEADEFTTQEVSPSFWYAKSGNGDKITQFKHETAGDSFESFHDRMIRSYVAGAKWSYSLTWKPTGQGTAERGEILRARKAVISRQKRLEAWALRVITYAYSFANAQGILPDLDEPFNWGFTRPPRLSVDDGRESRMDIERFRLGVNNMTDLLEHEGRTYDEHIRLRMEEAVKRKQILQEAEEKYGVSIDERELVMFTNNEKPDEENNNQNNDQSITQ